MGDSFLDAYLPIVERRKQDAWGERERDFQLYRRGRYVEFNLVCMPPLARWEYAFTPEPGSREAQLHDYLVPRDWLAEATQQNNA